MSNSKVIYIVGRGHSGSTILSSLLGYLPTVVDVGELIYPMDRQCGCGKPFAECEFWRTVQQTFETATGLPWQSSLQAVRDQAHFLRFPSTMLTSRSASNMRHLRRVDAAITAAVLEVASAQHMLDSSKQPARALFLMRSTDDTRFLHIVRSPESYLTSYLRRVRKGRVNFLRREFRPGPLNALLMVMVTLSWLIANLQAEYVRLLDSQRVLRVRYEDLVANPRAELHRIEGFLNLDLKPVITAIDEGRKMRVSHIIGGNDHMRSDGGFVIEPHVGQSTPLPIFYRLMVRLISWPLMLRYGYPIFAQQARLSSDLHPAPRR